MVDYYVVTKFSIEATNKAEQLLQCAKLQITIRTNTGNIHANELYNCDYVFNGKQFIEVHTVYQTLIPPILRAVSMHPLK